MMTYDDINDEQSHLILKKESQSAGAIRISIYKRNETQSTRLTQSLWQTFALVASIAGITLWTTSWSLYVTIMFTGVIIFSVDIAIKQFQSLNIVEESILVIPSVGVQLESKRKSGKISVEFFPCDIVHGIVLYEAITYFRVVYRLALIVSSRKSMITVFPSLSTRLCHLESVLKWCQPLIANKTEY